MNKNIMRVVAYDLKVRTYNIPIYTPSQTGFAIGHIVAIDMNGSVVCDKTFICMIPSDGRISLGFEGGLPIGSDVFIYYTCTARWE